MSQEVCRISTKPVTQQFYDPVLSMMRDGTLVGYIIFHRAADATPVNSLPKIEFSDGTTLVACPEIEWSNPNEIPTWG